MLVYEDGLAAGLDGLGVGAGEGHGVAGVLGELIEVVLVALGAVGAQQTAAREVLEAGIDELEAYLVVAAAAGLVRVEGGGGGVVEVDRGDDADLPAELLMYFLGDGLVGDSGRLVHVDGAGVGLVPGRDGGRGGGGVGAEAVAVVSDGGARDGEVHEVQGDGAVENGAAVVVEAGLGLHVIGVLKRAEVVRGGLDLGIAHAVADEEEHILGCGRGLRQGGGLRLGGLGYGSGAGRRGGLGLTAAGGEHAEQQHGGEE